MRRLAVLMIGLLILGGCGAGGGIQGSSSASSSAAASASAGSTSGPASSPSSGAASTGGKVTVGGFAVRVPGKGEVKVPKVTATRDEIKTYLNQVRPIIRNTEQQVAQVANLNAKIKNGNFSASANLKSVQNAEQATRRGFEKLKSVQPPKDLRPIHEKLVQAYDQALPAYKNLGQALQSGNLRKITTSVGKNLPDVQRQLLESRKILRQLSRESG